MTFSLNRFRAGLQYDPASQSLFEVSITSLPKQLSGMVARSLPYKCQNAEFPGKVIATSPLKDYGPNREIAYGALYDDVTLEFIVTDNMDEKVLFEKWQQYIIDDSSGSDVEYYNNYIGEIRIDQYSKEGGIVHSVLLEEAYPKVVNSLPLSWDATNTYHKLSVNITYRSHITLT